MATSLLVRRSTAAAAAPPRTLLRALPCVLNSGVALPSYAGLQLGPAACVGAIREKKHKPFHNMYRANRMKEIRKKQQEAADAEALEALDGTAALNVVKREEPKVGTTPFQAARLMRAFDVFPEKASTVTFWTRLNVDLSRESVRGTCHLPHGLKSDIRVLAFCPDDEVEEMLAAGADYAGITEPLRRIGTGWLGFDRCLATPNIMPQVMKVARVLGPKRMMPNPRSGTVVTNLKGAIQEAKGGTLLEYRAESEGEIRAIIADQNFSDAQVLENLKFFVQTLLRARPRGSSGGGGAPGAAAGGSKPLIPGAPATAAGGDAQDSYFLEAGIQLGSDGPLVRMDTD
eukprot:CAMPEP_0206547970 /NCGR_PEP_ID=MMETSP0325_2-20121206/13609_1 /ASSEMBLY_ACC=CAM_ASM_000347 /TAXON_ID=2866 /ORGANISM="Crypthecodinium cohnii, Strain Seligo" /LENGTH=343 /DNA_ID=CAMNT_0054047369 /DNA_START=8 /DNA_END=1036 /DNA_ORIENTATION=-